MVKQVNKEEGSERGQRQKGSADERPVCVCLCVCVITCCFYLWTNTENDSSDTSEDTVVDNLV